jgi:hypothetical protein
MTEDKADGDRSLAPLEEKVNRHDYALFGFNGTNGLNGRVRDLEEGRDMDMRDRLSAQRLVTLAALSAVIALIGTIAALVMAVNA